MKKNIVVLSFIAVLILVLSLVSCNSKPQDTSEANTQSPETTAIPSTPIQSGSLTTDPIQSTSPETGPQIASNEISLSYICKANDSNSKEKSSDSGKVTVSSKTAFKEGDQITVKLAENRHYIYFTISKDFKEALIYVPGDSYTLTVPNDYKSYWPSNIFISISARYPSDDELKETVNLALNPYDTKSNESDYFPHAYSNNNYNNSEFGAHCAIDGFTSNKAHGTYPYQSWGPNSTVKDSDTFVIDFGREVTVDQLITYIRADFSTSGSSHDAYFSEYTVKFSDGSTITVNPVKTADAQTFELGGKTTTSLTITGFVTDKANSQGWAGFTEVMVMGHNN